MDIKALFENLAATIKAFVEGFIAMIKKLVNDMRGLDKESTTVTVGE